ncbi:hypothetical protein GCM10008983_16300 [Lentibacillus halophilus]|uniref:D-alanyl-D-alanine carboxypeptidase n=1 Tax=Lentibacillus halophilus TaxID=295065 RepID=A0ABP3J3F9_9BACI
MFYKNVLIIIILSCLSLTACDNNSPVNQAEPASNSEQSEKNKTLIDNPEQTHKDKEENPSKQKQDSSSQEQNKDTAKDNENSGNNQTDNTNDKVLPSITLTQGDRGNNVSSVQQTFNQLGYSLTEDGLFDQNTAWAIKDFQAQIETLNVDGVYGPNTRDRLLQAVEGKLTINPGNGISQDSESHSDKQERDDQEKNYTIVSNPSDILVLVNKNHRLPNDYIPNQLVIPNVRFPFDADLPKKQMRKNAANALEQMFVAGDKDGVDLFAQSGYRSFDRQEAIFAANARKHGKKAANQFSAQPGESEHQTGLTMDVTSADINFRLTTDFANTDEGQWVKKHASNYGFIIRYPKGKTNITGYQYEPWHLRYVGQKAAQTIDSKNMTLEEYLDAR